MDWGYAILMIALVGWCIQMVIDYFRKSAAIRQGLNEAQREHEEVRQAEEETRNQLQDLLKQIEATDANGGQLAKREAELQEKIAEVKKGRKA